MFEDLSPGKTREEIENEQMRELLGECKQEIIDLRNENHIMDKKFVEAVTDCKRLGKIITDNWTPEQKEKILEDIGDQDEHLVDYGLSEDEDFN